MSVITETTYCYVAVNDNRSLSVTAVNMRLLHTSTHPCIVYCCITPPGRLVHALTLINDHVQYNYKQISRVNNELQTDVQPTYSLLTTHSKCQWNELKGFIKDSSHSLGATQNISVYVSATIRAPHTFLFVLVNQPIMTIPTYTSVTRWHWKFEWWQTDILGAAAACIISQVMYNSNTNDNQMHLWMSLKLLE